MNSSFLESISLYIQVRTESPEWRGHFGKCGTAMGVLDERLSNSTSQAQAAKGLPLHCLLTKSLTEPPADLEKWLWGKKYRDSWFWASIHTFSQLKVFWSCVSARHEKTSDAQTLKVQTLFTWYSSKLGFITSVVGQLLRIYRDWLFRHYFDDQSSIQCWDKINLLLW